MPPYPWLLEKDVDWSRIPGKIRAMRTLGVPYPDWTDEEILANVEAQANEIVADLESNFRSTAPEREIVALIAYLQKLGVSEDAASAAARRDSAR
jgi:cytochrome c oxidase cbb3-type subunit I/II